MSLRLTMDIAGLAYSYPNRGGNYRFKLKPQKFWFTTDKGETISHEEVILSEEFHVRDELHMRESVYSGYTV